MLRLKNKQRQKPNGRPLHCSRQCREQVRFGVTMGRVLVETEGALDGYSPKLTDSIPRNSADWPSCSSMRRSWLYFAIRSVRLAEPVLIWPAPVPTARSAMKVSSVSPERWLMMEV